MPYRITLPSPRSISLDSRYHGSTSFLKPCRASLAHRQSTSIGSGSVFAELEISRPVTPIPLVSVCISALAILLQHPLVIKSNVVEIFICSGNALVTPSYRVNSFGCPSLFAGSKTS